MAAPGRDRLSRAGVLRVHRIPAGVGRRRPAGRVVGLLLLVVALVVALPAHARPVDPSRAPLPEQSPVQVLLQEVDPVVVVPGQAVVVRGTVRNVGTAPVDATAVRLTTAYRGLDTRTAVAAWATGELALDTPRLLGEDQLGTELAPGAQAAFEIRVRPDAVAAPFEFATLPLSVEVLDDRGPAAVRGRLRSYLLWDGREEYGTPLELGWVVPVTLPADPDLAATDDRARAEAWSGAVGPDSPARRLVEDLASTSVTFVVDPAMLDPVMPIPTLAQPVGGPDGDGVDPTGVTDTPTPTPSPPPADTARPDRGAPTASPLGPTPVDRFAEESADPAAGLRRDLGALAADRLWWLPPGDPDTTALLDLGRTPREVGALLAQPEPPSGDGADGPEAAAPPSVEQLLERGRRDVAWPVAGPSSLSDERLQELGDTYAAAAPWTSGLAGVLAPGSSLDRPGEATTDAAAPHAGGTVLLGYDERLSGAAARAGSAQDSGAAVQRLLAETMAVYQQRPAEPRSLLVAAPRGGTPDPAALVALTSALGQAPWVRPVPAADLLAAAEGATPVGLAGGTPVTPAPGDPAAYPVAGRSPLSVERLEEVERIRERLDGAALVVPAGDDGARAWHRVLDQQVATRWRQDPTRWEVPLARAAQVADEVLEGVHINPTTINFLADEGLVQITVVNDLAVAVTGLRLTVQPRNARLRVVEQPEPFTVGPNSRATVQFRARAVAAGEVPVETTLATPNGTPVGETELLQVRVQPTGDWIYWVLGGTAGVVLVLGLWRALRPARTPRAAARSEESA